MLVSAIAQRNVPGQGRIEQTAKRTRERMKNRKKPSLEREYQARLKTAKRGQRWRGNEQGEKTRALGQKEKKKKAEETDRFRLKNVKHVVFQNPTKQMRPCRLFKGK